MNIKPEDILESVNKVRENPSLALNEIKDQLKKSFSPYAGSSPTASTAIKRISRSGLSPARWAGKMPS